MIEQVSGNKHEDNNENKHDDKQTKARIYYVNGEKFETEEKKLNVRFILEEASFKPAEDYWLVRDNGNQKLENYEEEIPIHNDETFTAVFKAQTPVSGV